MFFLMFVGVFFEKKFAFVFFFFFIWKVQAKCASSLNTDNIKIYLQ